jgi:hypothetical protein
MEHNWLFGLRNGDASYFMLDTGFVNYTGLFIMFFVITNMYNKKNKGRTLMVLFTATGKLKKVFTARDVRCVHHGCTVHTSNISSCKKTSL